MADKRIPVLLDTPAAVRFVSVEPMLGPMDLRRYLKGPGNHFNDAAWPSLSWVICGGESAGTPDRALVEPCVQWSSCRAGYPRRGEICGACWGMGTGRRKAGAWVPKPTGLDWVRSLKEQCVAARVPFLLKQWGGPKPKSGGRRLDGRTWDEFPEAVSGPRAKESIHA